MNLTDLPQYVYHYTSMQSLKNIIDHKCIWATESSYMNDPNEIKYGYEVLKKELERRDCRKQFDRLVSFPTFFTSFSKEPDLLSQWRAYAKEGGVSIGFPSAELTSIRDGYVLRSCVYSDDYNRLSELIDWAINIYDSHCELVSESLFDYSEAPDPHDPSTLAYVFSILLSDIAPLIKHYAYKEEKEVRLISQTIKNLQKGKLTYNVLRFNELEYRASKGIIKPYQIIDISKALSHIKIIIGPNPNRDLAYKSLNDYLRKKLLAEYQYDTKINDILTMSGVPYRDI